MGVGVVAVMECDKCGYEWEYSGSMIYATCPSCKASVKVGENHE